jgi:thioredoxin-like negative regulator of GroEL
VRHPRASWALLLLGLAGCATGERGLEQPGIGTSREVSELEERVRHHPGDHDARVRLGQMMLSLGRNERAVTELERAHVDRPDDLRGRFLLAEALGRGPQASVGRARDLLEETVRTAPGNGDAHLRLAQLYARLGDVEAAMDAFLESTRLADDPATELAARLGLLSLYRKRGDASGAEAALEAARRIYPDVDDLLESIAARQATSPPRRVQDTMHPLPRERARRLIDQLRENPRPW